jgi:predicted pyridoxine 5'-phosphate oxidase superfamily flavin-nucleotide-binding protein
MPIQQPFHEGELEVQARAGEGEVARHNGRAIATTIVRGAIPFLAAQRFCVLATTDAGGQPWASVLFGDRGFIAANETALEIDLARAAVVADDPLWENLRDSAAPMGARVGLLALEPETRRRLRVNGRARLEAGRLRVAVEESFPNCPKYIQRRALEAFERAPDAPAAPARTGTTLGAEERAAIESADTFFIASAHPVRGLDASHRGGNPGFVRASPTRLRVPDYPGNGMFQTLGNLAVDARAGLVFVDLERARTLQLVGRVAVRWNEEPDGLVTGGTGRSWELAVEGFRSATIPARLVSRWVDASPYNP